jgi:hypothetical protein
VNTSIVTQHEQITKWLVAIDATTDLTGQPDNVYPFNGVEDQWAVVMNGTQIAWTAEYGTACMIYVTALQTRREHAERCPADSIPFSGEPVVYDSDADDYAIPAVTLWSSLPDGSSVGSVSRNGSPKGYPRDTPKGRRKACGRSIKYWITI